MSDLAMSKPERKAARKALRQRKADRINSSPGKASPQAVKEAKKLAEREAIAKETKRNMKFVKIDLPDDPDRERIYRFFDETYSDEFKRANAANMFLTTAQVIALRSIYESTIRYGWHLNSSPTGSGKTVMTLALAKALGIKYNKVVKIVTVLPATLIGKAGGSSAPWMRECKIYHEVDNLIQVSIETVRHKKVVSLITAEDPMYKETSFAPDTLPAEKLAARNDSKRKTVFNLEQDGTGFIWYNEREKDMYGSDLLKPKLRSSESSSTRSSRSRSRSSSSSSSDAGDPGDGYQFGLTAMLAAKMEKYERESKENVVSYKKDKKGRKVKVETEVKSLKYDYNFYVTPSVEWMQFCVDNIVLLVFDEAHSGKNAGSGQNQAIAALIRGVRRARAIREDKASFFAFLTATPMEKKEHAISYMKMIGYTNPLKPPGHEKLDMTIDENKRKAYPCYLEAREYDKEMADKIAIDGGIITGTRGKEALNKNKSKGEKVTAKDHVSIIYDLWSKCILPKTHVAVLSDSNRELFNAFIDITIEENVAHINKANELLKRADEILKRNKKQDNEDYDFDRETDYDGSEESEDVKPKGSKSKDKKQKKGELLTLFGESRRMVEEAMIFDMVRFSVKIMAEHPNDRVLLGFTAIDSVDIARFYFEEENSVKTGRVAGPTSLKKKATKFGSQLPKPDGLTRFNKTNADRLKSKDIEAFRNGTLKVLVATLQSIATGKDLHDIIYREPGTPGHRVWSLMPGDYNLTMEQQFAGRTARIGSQTIPVIMLVYPKSFGENIMKVYDSGKAKSDIAKAILSARRHASAISPEQKLFRKKLVLPGEYNRYIELPCSSISCVMDKPEYKLNDAKDDIELVIPNFKQRYRFLKTNDEDGRAAYTKVDEVIKFMEESCSGFMKKNQELKIQNKQDNKGASVKVSFQPYPSVVLEEYMEANGIFTMPIGSSELNPYPALDAEIKKRLVIFKSGPQKESDSDLESS
jgi:hypothetical protein